MSLLLPSPGSYVRRWDDNEKDPQGAWDYLRVYWSSPPNGDYPDGWVSYLGTLTRRKPTSTSRPSDIAAASGGISGRSLRRAGWEAVAEKDVPPFWREWFDNKATWPGDLEILAWAASMEARQ